MVELIFFSAAALAWGFACFALGYRIAQRRTTYSMVFGPARPTPMSLDNTVARTGSERGRVWEEPGWVARAEDTR